jgi:DHA3 family macrolide efflux protein-like MFS transporter
MKSAKKSTPAWKRKAMVFLLGQGISLFGSQLVQMALIWHITLETSSGLWVTLLTLAAFLPQTIMSPFAGVWADRYDRKRIIILADAGIAAFTLLLAIFMMSGNTKEAALPVIVAVSVLRSLGSGIQTPAVNAMLPQLVPEEGLMKTNAINGSIQSFIQFIAPVAAGAVLAAGPIYNILLIDVLTAAAGIGILAYIKIPKHQTVKKADAASVFIEMKEGFLYTLRHRFLRRLLGTYGVYLFLSVPAGFLTALMIERTFGSHVLFLTVNETVGFAGALAGGLLLGATGGFKNRNKTFFLGALLYGIASFAVGFTSVFWVFAALMFVLGLTIPAAQSSVFTLVQEKTEPSMLGRVFSLVNVMYAGFMPLGVALFGPLSDVVRIQTLVVVCAVFVVVLAFSVVFSGMYYRAGVPVSSAKAE